MTEWELCKCFRAFNTVHEKLPSVGLSPPPPPPTLSLVQTLTQIQQEGFVGGGGAIFRWAISRETIFRSRWQFYRRQFSSQNLNGAFQIKINATSSVE